MCVCPYAHTSLAHGAPGSRTWLLAPMTRAWKMESARPWTHLTEAPGAPEAPLSRDHSTQSQLARVCTMGLLTGVCVHSSVCGVCGVCVCVCVYVCMCVLPCVCAGVCLCVVCAVCVVCLVCVVCVVCVVWMWVCVCLRPRPPRPRNRAAGLGCLPQGQALGGGRVPDLGHPSPRQGAQPSGRPCAAPKARKASSPERALWVW